MTLVLLIAFTIAMAAAGAAGQLANSRRRSVLGWSLASAILPPLALLLYCLPEEQQVETSA